MNRLIDKALLLFYSLGTCLLVPADPWYVFFFFLAVALSCVMEAAEKKVFSLTVLGFYGLLTLAEPVGIFFFPLLVYDGLSAAAFSWKALWLWLPAGAVLFVTGAEYTPFIIYYLLWGSFFGGLLWYRNVSYEKLSHTFRRVRDDGMERTILLKEKNKTLIEKQNYEIYAATLKERNRIAREIHDHVGHMLSRAILMTGAMRTVLRDPSAAEPLAQLEDTLNTAMNNIRESVHDLHDEAVDLRTTVETLAAGFRGCPVALEYDIAVPPPAEVRYCMIAVLKEGLSNISAHSQATKAWIMLREHPAMYQLIIQDNGAGFPPGRASSADGSIPRGIGLANMRERVEALDGLFHLQTDQGFRIFISIPKKS